MWIRLALLLALTLGVALSGLFAFRAGYKAGSAAIEVRWQQDTLSRESALISAQRAAQAELARQVAVHQEVERGLQDRLAAADVRGRDLGRRLRIALAAARPRLPVPGAAPGPADGSGRESPDAAATGAALAEHLAACERDAQRLTDLQDYWRAVVR